LARKPTKIATMACAIMIRMLHDPQLRAENSITTLDGEIETVSARRAKAFGVLQNQFPLCCRPKILKIIAQELWRLPFCQA
jgi:hypothetical protein